MSKGGYQIIDLKNKNHNIGESVYHEGIYDKIEGTRKVILLSNIVIENVEYHDMFVFPMVSGTTFVMDLNKIGGDNRFVINVEDDDTVTINQI